MTEVPGCEQQKGPHRCARSKEPSGHNDRHCGEVPEVERDALLQGMTIKPSFGEVMVRGAMG